MEAFQQEAMAMETKHSMQAAQSYKQLMARKGRKQTPRLILHSPDNITKRKQLPTE